MTVHLYLLCAIASLILALVFGGVCWIGVGYVIPWAIGVWG